MSGDTKRDTTDQKHDKETNSWVSDIKPGAGAQAKADKAVEDTFPASDPANMNTGTTGFITPGGEDLGDKTDKGVGETGIVSTEKP
ncbi:hypothetical protein J8J14_20190 [Roseomonas sp. SSH11]|uniref:Uncharacterized protein n=1 Tax=Pararoseomonas baculiformis TaxID=2820812 RepID=A0ABS4AKR7_9PROT|nr:hypothetical protein [Pararoseomonas baculiformis]MBP0447100.1 hypothetical protein [Pararoseomonas baculiformis]